MKISISQITIENRFRKEYGDIEALSQSIQELGQLQPIGVDSNYRLIFGERRIKAAQLLGHDSIEGNVIHLENAVKGEFAENEFSEGWKISERVAILKAIDVKKIGDNQHGGSENFPTLTLAEAAQKAGFGNERTARDATKAIDEGIPELVEKVDSGDVSVSAAAKISALEEEVQHEIIEEISEGAKPAEVVKKYVHVSEGNNDWYTPDSYVESARKVLISIDLDPASSDLAQKTIKATEYHTEESNGLNQEWKDKTIWMNPPYSMPLIREFIDKLIDESTKSWIVLTNNSSDTGWFHKLLSESDLICLTKGRVSFENGEKVMATRQGQAFFYKGDNQAEFAEEFKQYGAILEVKHEYQS